MATNALHVAWLSRLADKGIIAKGQSIVEFSPQDVMAPRAAVRQYALRHNPAEIVDRLLDEIFDGEKPRLDGIPAFYRLFGIERYRCTDLFDPRADWKNDFNRYVMLPERFDLATNFGTAEHVFNIGELFHSIHDVLRPGGVALHELPAFGDVDHGFYNVHPTVYFDLAVANDYTIEDIFYADRWDIRNKMLEADLVGDFDFDALPIKVEHMKNRSVLQRMVTERFITNYNDPNTRRFGEPYPGLLYDYCVVALRKNNLRPFRFPVQAYYADFLTHRPTKEEGWWRKVARTMDSCWVKVNAYWLNLYAYWLNVNPRWPNVVERWSRVAGVGSIIIKNTRERGPSWLIGGIFRRIRRIGFVSFAIDQAMKTIRRPSRVILIPYHIGREKISGLAVRASEEVTAPAKEISVPKEVKRIFVPKAVEVDVKNVFELVTKRLVREPYPADYQISKVWRSNLSIALARAGEKPSAIELAYLGLDLNFDVGIAELSASDREAIFQMRRGFNLKHDELSSLCESPVCPENMTVRVDEGTHSNKMNQALSYYDQIYSGIQKSEQLNVIVEIGSGYGRFARIMHQVDPRRCYILVDLSESLIFSYAFLAVNFPGARTLFISSEVDARAAAMSKFDFVFCPIQFLDHLCYEKVDLLINTYSFSEMPQTSLDYLMRCIHEVLRPRYLYSLNTAFSDKDILYDAGGLDGEANETVLKLEPEWRVRHFSLVPAVLEGKYRLTAGVVVERTPGLSKEAVANAAVAAANELEFGHPARLGNLYFAAQWSLDAEIADRFFFELEQYCINCKFPANTGYDFERIGEVRYLNRLLSREHSMAMSNRRCDDAHSGVDVSR